MIKSIFMRSLLVSSLTFVSALHSTSAFGMSCTSLLGDRTVQLTRAQVSQDLMALEILSSMALAKELQHARGFFGTLELRFSNFMAGAEHPPLSSIPRLDHEDALEFGPSSFGFSDITQRDKDYIISVLPGLVKDLVDSSQEGRRFNKEFTDKTSEILNRNTELDTLIHDNIDAIILNAIRMPKIPLGARVRMVLGKNFNRLKWAPAILGATFELVNPNGLFLMIEPSSYHSSFYDLAEKTENVHYGFRVMGNAVIFHLGGYGLDKAVKAVGNGVLLVKERVFHIEHSNYDKYSYDHEAGESAREDLADLVFEDNTGQSPNR